MPDPAALRASSIPDLVTAARTLNIENPAGLRKPDLVAAILRASAAPQAEGSGILEILPDGFGFLRAPEYSYLPGPDDVYVSPSQIRRFNLRNGDTISGQMRAPKENERYFALIKVERVNGEDPDTARERVVFENLRAAAPDRHLPVGGNPTARLLDRLVPLGRGQRAVVRGPPRSGKTTVMRDLAAALTQGHPGLDLTWLLVAGRPEEATELEDGATFPVLVTTFDEPDARHVQVVDMAIERARRIAEHKRDAVLVVDGLNALVRASAAVATPTGRTFVDGLDFAAVARSRRLLATARAIHGGGSVTVIASVQTGTPTDDAICRELTGYENWLLPLCSDPRHPSVDLGAVHAVDRFLPADAREERARWRKRVGLDLDAALQETLDVGTQTGEQAPSLPSRS